MVVMAIMPALCPLRVVEMVLGDLAGERAGGEGAGWRDTHPGVAPGVRMGDGVFVCANRAITRCHRTRVRPATEPYLSFPIYLQEPSPQTTVAQHSAPWDHPTRPGPPHIPPRGLWAGCGGRTSSGTFLQRDWQRPLCLSHGHRALQGEELHPRMGREVIGHGPVSGGYWQPLRGRSPGAGSPVGPGAGQGAIAGGSRHILSTARLAADAQHRDVPGGLGAGVVGQGGVEGHVGLDGVSEVLECGLGSPRPRAVVEVGYGCREGMGVRRDLVGGGCTGTPARPLPWAAPTYHWPGTPPARCRRCRSHRRRSGAGPARRWRRSSAPPARAPWSGPACTSAGLR